VNRMTVLFVLAALVVAGCASASGDARRALNQGRYADAASGFESVLARDPDRVDALVGLGVAKYKEGAFDEAIEPLDRAVAREPKLPTARLYLALAHLRKGEYGPVEENLGALVAQRQGTRLALQADRALRLLRGSDPISDDMRTFVAASLEDEAELERQAAEALAAQRAAESRWRSSYYPVYSRPIWCSHKRC
jgi:tetratricopeptide (TPR) repeat protein